MKNKINKARLKLLNKIIENLDESVPVWELQTYAAIIEQMASSHDQILELLIELTKETGVTNDSRRNDYAIFGR